MATTTFPFPFDHLSVLTASVNPEGGDGAVVREAAVPTLVWLPVAPPDRSVPSGGQGTMESL